MYRKDPLIRFRPENELVLFAGLRPENTVGLPEKCRKMLCRNSDFNSGLHLIKITLYFYFFKFKYFYFECASEKFYMQLIFEY